MISVFISKCYKTIFTYWQLSIGTDLKILDDKYTGMKMTNMKSKENGRSITHISWKNPACCINVSASAKYRHKVTNILNTHTNRPLVQRSLLIFISILSIIQMNCRANGERIIVSGCHVSFIQNIRGSHIK